MDETKNKEPPFKVTVPGSLVALFFLAQVGCIMDPPKFHIDPEKWWLEEYDFQDLC